MDNVVGSSGLTLATLLGVKQGLLYGNFNLKGNTVVYSYGEWHILTLECDFELNTLLPVWGMAVYAVEHNQLKIDYPEDM